MVIRYVSSCIFMITNKTSEIILQRLQWLNPKMYYTMHVINGIYNNIHQNTDSFALKIAYFNHIQTDCL